MQDNDKSLVLGQIAMIQCVAIELGQSEYKKASKTLSEWIMEA